jgi:hypothetical protein
MKKSILNRSTMLCLGLLGLASCSTQPAETNQQIIDQITAPDQEAGQTNQSEFSERKTSAKVPPKLLQAAESYIGNQMKDPDTVKFRGLFMTSNQTSEVVCGSINAKNSYGGYVGFKPFYVEFAEDKPIGSGTPPFADSRVNAVCGAVNPDTLDGFVSAPS